MYILHKASLNSEIYGVTTLANTTLVTGGSEHIISMLILYLVINYRPSEGS